MKDSLSIQVNSEIGELQGVILHTPGDEVENMNPRNAENALYSDILNLSVILEEYSQFHSVLKKMTKVFQVNDLLEEILKDEKVKDQLIKRICKNENADFLIPDLLELSPNTLAKQLIEGVPRKRNTLTGFLAKEKSILRPTYNFFFTRDASMSVRDNVLIGKMAGKVREREAVIMDAIFEHSPRFDAKVINQPSREGAVIEGGDILIAREDILLTGFGGRTTTEGIDFITERFCEQKGRRHIIAQQLPTDMESFIHLDMLFTILDVDTCMAFPPIIKESNQLKTIEITIDNGKVKKITEEKNIIKALQKHGMNLKPVLCGGDNPSTVQEREQWHSGANFFALAPGLIMGYERNIHTIEALSKAGFEVIKASDFISGEKNISKGKKTVINVAGSELARGGGGCRCMTMPVSRKELSL